MFIIFEASGGNKKQNSPFQQQNIADNVNRFIIKETGEGGERYADFSDSLFLTAL